MGERLNLVDRYDLTCMKDDINRDMVKLYNTEISPIKKSLQLHRSQIDGIGEIVMSLSDEIENIKKEHEIDAKGIIDYNFNQTDTIVKLDEKINKLNNTITILHDEIEENKEWAIESNRKTNFDKTRFDKLLLSKTNRLFEKISILEDKMIDIEKRLFIKFYYFCLFISIVYLISYFIF